jgi:hypothetical protein
LGSVIVTLKVEPLMSMSAVLPIFILGVKISVSPGFNVPFKDTLTGVLVYRTDAIPITMNAIPAAKTA